MQEYIEECDKIDQCDRMGGFQTAQESNNQQFKGREEDFADKQTYLDYKKQQTLANFGPSQDDQNTVF